MRLGWKVKCDRHFHITVSVRGLDGATHAAEVLAHCTGDHRDNLHHAVVPATFVLDFQHNHDADDRTVKLHERK